MAGDKHLRCSFCGKSKDSVKKFISGPNVYICNECISLCNEILAEEEDREATSQIAEVLTPAEIKAYMESLAPLVERGGFIPFCDHRCPPNVKPADYLYYLDLKEEMFGLG